jgi:hypothetical protein
MSSPIILKLVCECLQKENVTFIMASNENKILCVFDN